MRHNYKVTVVDVDNNPLSGVTVKLRGESKHTASKTDVCTTDAEGNCPEFNYEVNRNTDLNYVTSYTSELYIEIEKAGYYKYKRTEFLNSDSTTDKTSKSTLRMLRPTDYLEPKFAESADDRELKERVLSFLDSILKQGFLNDTTVMLKGIGISEFKGRKYLRIKLDSTTAFNSLKLNKYEVGKRLFDDSVRKILNPLNDSISTTKAFQGYDIVVYGYSKSFLDKEAKPQKLEYRFLLPEKSVRRYKDKDISGQSLIDASVVLLDDERIDLKLQ